MAEIAREKAMGIRIIISMASAANNMTVPIATSLILPFPPSYMESGFLSGSRCCRQS